VIWSAARRALRAIWAPASVALIVGACTMSLVVHRHEQIRRQQLLDRADVVETAIRSIDLDAERAAASVAGTLSVTSDPAQIQAAIGALAEAPALVSTVAVVDDVGTIVAANRDSSLVARAVIEARFDDLPAKGAVLVLSDAQDERDRLLFAARSRSDAATVLVELTLDRSALQALPEGTAFAATVIDPRVGGTIARTDAPLGQRTVRRNVTIGGQPAILAVSGDDRHGNGGAWAAAALAALCAAVVTTTLRSALRWRSEHRTLDHDERLLDGVLSHQQQMEADLRISETQLRAVLESTPDAVALIEPAHARCRLLNRSEFLGHSAAQFERGGFVFAIAGDDAGELRRWWSSLSIARGDAGNHIEFWATSADGRQCRMQLRAAPFPPVGLSVQHRCLGVFTDITTEHQQREHEMVMLRELEQVRHLESLGRLAGGIAHDFRNVLAAVDMNAELLTARVQPEVRRYIEVIQGASGRAAEMVRQLLSFAKRDLGEPVAVDVSHAVLDMKSLLQSSVTSAVSIELDLDDVPCVTRAGPGHLDRVILNLVCNARDAMPLGGTIRIATARGPCAIPSSAPERDWVLLVVADNGPGIPEDIIGKVFDPFFTTKGPAGSGLGLASVHGIISALGGHVTVTSIPGSGTTVTIALPPVEVVSPPMIATKRDTTPTRTGRRVILVDDDDDVREATAQFIRERGFEVVEASTAYEGLAAMAQSPPDVLVTDIVMPGGMNGLDLADLTRQEFPGVAVVLMSAYADALIPDRSPMPHRLVCKPISTDDLLDALEHAGQEGT
jgi:signal transduction histidine kinase